MKSVVAALSITVTLLSAAPTITASPARATKSQSTRAQDDHNNDRFAAMRQFINRAIRRVVTFTGPSVPIPKPEPTNPE